MVGDGRSAPPTVRPDPEPRRDREGIRGARTRAVRGGSPGSLGRDRGHRSRRAGLGRERDHVRTPQAPGRGGELPGSEGLGELPGIAGGAHRDRVEDRLCAPGRQRAGALAEHAETVLRVERDRHALPLRASRVLRHRGLGPRPGARRPREHNHGAVVHEQIAANKRKTVLLFVVAIAFTALIGYAIGFLFFYGGVAGVVIATILAVVLSLGSYFAGDRIVLASTGAREVTAEQEPRLNNIVEGIAIAAGVPKPRVYVVPEQAPNAFATGRNPEHSSIAVTQGLLDTMNRVELEGVIGHEMSHVLDRDILVGTVVATVVGAAILMSEFFTRSWFWSGGRMGRRDSGGGGAGIVTLVLFAIGRVLLILAPLAGRPRAICRPAVDRPSTGRRPAGDTLPVRTATVRGGDTRAARDRHLHREVRAGGDAEGRRHHGRHHGRAGEDRRGRRGVRRDGARARSRRHPQGGRRGPHGRPDEDRGEQGDRFDPGDGEGQARSLRGGPDPAIPRGRLRRRVGGPHAG